MTFQPGRLDGLFLRLRQSRVAPEFKVVKPVSAFDIVVLTFIIIIIFFRWTSLAQDSSSIPFDYHIFNVSEIKFVAKINSATDFLLQHSFPNFFCPQVRHLQEVFLIYDSCHDLTDNLWKQWISKNIKLQDHSLLVDIISFWNLARSWHKILMRPSKDLTNLQWSQINWIFDCIFDCMNSLSLIQH